MCLACIEADIWAAYQADLAKRAGEPPRQAEPAASTDEDAKVRTGAAPAGGPAASECDLT